jgi:hypothetical protein
MNVLFQATLPLPHLLYEKVQGAKDELNVCLAKSPGMAFYQLPM